MHRTLFTIILLTVAFSSYCQVYSFTYRVRFDYLQHIPDADDEKTVKVDGYLKDQQPDSNNYDNYYRLACSLWELKRVHEAEKMFLVIVNSNETYYSAIEHHPSLSLYGYGSYSASYKNSAAVYLTKTYIEQRKFNKAFSFLEDATKKYIVAYNCGTAEMEQQDEYIFLYGCIYEGEKKYEKVMELLLPECLSRNDDIIVRTIKQLYSKEQIKEKLQQAEHSIQCELDTAPSFAYRSRNNVTDTLTYYSGTATINLFDKVVKIPAPGLENGEHITKERFLREFKESDIYSSLTEK